VFDVKHDGRHKSQLVAGGNLIFDGCIPGKVNNLVCLILVIFLAELNGLTLYSADVCNAYLEAKTKEKSTSIQMLALEILKVIPSLSVRHCMDKGHLDYAGMNTLLIHSEVWASHLHMLIQVFRQERIMGFMNI